MYILFDGEREESITASVRSYTYISNTVTACSFAGHALRVAVANEFNLQICSINGLNPDSLNSILKQW